MLRTGTKQFITVVQICLPHLPDGIVTSLHLARRSRKFDGGCIIGNDVYRKVHQRYIPFTEENDALALTWSIAM